MRGREKHYGPGAEGFTLVSVLSAFAALGEAFQVAAEVRKGMERLGRDEGRPERAGYHAGAAEAYTAAAGQLLDLVSALEDQDAPWERDSPSREVLKVEPSTRRHR